MSHSKMKHMSAFQGLEFTLTGLAGTQAHGLDQIVSAEKTRYGSVCRGLVEFARSTSLPESAADHYRNPIAQSKRLLLVVSDINSCQTKTRNQLAQLTPGFFA